MFAHETLKDFFRPDYIFVDETAAATSMDTATPLATFKDSVRAVVLIGDHRQLPHTFVSKGRNAGAGEMSKTIFRRNAENWVTTTQMDLVPELHFFDT